MIIYKLFYSISSANWISYILHSSIFNGIITISTFLFFLHNGLKKEYSFLLSLSFGALAYPVSGTPFLRSSYYLFLSIRFLFSQFGINKKINIYFVPIFLGLGFFLNRCLQFISLFFLIIFLFYILITKKFKLLKYPFLVLSFLIFIYLFFTIQNIEINLLLHNFSITQSQ